MAGPSGLEALIINFPDFLRDEFSDHFDLAKNVTDKFLQLIPAADLSPLATHSPGLEGYEWSAYIRLSLLRLLRAGAALHKAGLERGRLLDFGAYFGNFSLFLKSCGFDVDAADNYSAYEHAFDPFTRVLREAGVGLIDLGAERHRLSTLEPASYDVVLCMGVIEHIPHTPKDLLVHLDRLLKPGGVMLIETPNLGYLYTRLKLEQGRSIFPPIELQFDVDVPFEGHHREYMPYEVEWMLRRIGHDIIDIELFNFSLYGLSRISDEDLKRFRVMEDIPEYRELILALSRKPG